MKLLEKPIVMEKFRTFYNNVRKNDWKIGTNLRVIELVGSNACNFKCVHCSTRASLAVNAQLKTPIDRIAEIADQAHELGIFELNFHGGELLLQPDYLFEAIKAVKPERFYTYLTSNGYLLDWPMAKRLRDAGIDRVSISIDSFDAEEHDNFRGQKGAFLHAIEALENVKNAHMDPFLNVCIGHHNVNSKEIEEILRYSKEKQYITFINIAIPAGCWQGNKDIILDENDRKKLIQLRKKYGNVLRDLWNPFDKENEKVLGCQTMSKLYVTPVGDVFPCSFMHIRIGNVYEQTLREIVNYGYSIKHFYNYSEKCLAGEDIDFMDKYLTKDRSMFHPLDAKELFPEEDYL